MLRRVIGRMYHRFVAFFFGLRIRDTDCDFRLIRQSSLDEIELVHTTGVICVELVRKLQDSGARFTEVGVHHYRRVYGKSEFFRAPCDRPHAAGISPACGSVSSCCAAAASGQSVGQPAVATTMTDVPKGTS